MLQRHQATRRLLLATLCTLVATSQTRTARREGNDVSASRRLWLSMSRRPNEAAHEQRLESDESGQSSSSLVDHLGRQNDELPLDDYFIRSRPRRLMGIFRCYGWGPGCSDVPTHQSTSQQHHVISVVRTSSNTSPSTDDNGHYVAPSAIKPEPEVAPAVESSSFKERSPQLSTTSSGGGRGSFGTRSGSRFQPFFVLTSGGSWGPTGKKRHLPRRYTTSDRRLDFLKQILRDMLEDVDDDDDVDGTLSRRTSSASSTTS
jgi:hypothetical protein